MARYIDADRLMSEFEDLMKDDNVMCPVIKVLDVFPIIDNIPTADVVEVVRCGSCKHFVPLNIFGDGLHGYCFEKISGAGFKKITSNDFCSRGEHKEKKEGET